MASWVGLVCLTGYYIVCVAGVLPSTVITPFDGTFGKVLHKRHAQETLQCILPPPMINGRFRPSGVRCPQNNETPECQMVPGTPVPPDWVIYFHYCNYGYSLNKNTTIAVCTNGNWKPRLPVCVGPDGFLGCFKDNGKRILRGHHQNFPGKLTTQMCVQQCARKGFLYAGTELRSHCFCGNVEPSRYDLEDTHQCNTKCAGDPGEICGGLWRLSLYITNSEYFRPNLRPLGCFKDAGNRLLAGHHQNFPGLLTIRMCVDHCARKGFKYAGTENGNQCFCGDVKPKPYHLENPSACNKPCPGNKEENCGGVWWVAVYATNITSNNNHLD